MTGVKPIKVTVLKRHQSGWYFFDRVITRVVTYRGGRRTVRYKNVRYLLLLPHSFAHIKVE